MALSPCGASSQNAQKAEGLGAGLSLLRPVFPLRPGQNSLIKQQVGAGGQDLLQAGLADSVVRDP